MRGPEAQAFAFNLEDNLCSIRAELLEDRWRPAPYASFFVRDPKLRHIHKASVRDRVLYQAVFRSLYPVFDPVFIHDSYSCREGKGTHAGVVRLESFLRKATANWSRSAYALKCDVRKFFDSISHSILLELIERRISDERTRALVGQIIGSFERGPGRGLPLGNVTSQLFANVYLNELDQFAKHELKAAYYLRYCDDFIIIDRDANRLWAHLARIREFLTTRLMLELHPHKISLRKTSQGVDFLGYIVLPWYRIVRTSTRRRIFRKLAAGKSAENDLLSAMAESYLGLVSHAKGHALAQKIKKITGLES